MLLMARLRRVAASVLALTGAFTVVGTAVTFGYVVRGGAGAWPVFAVLSVVTSSSWLLAFRLRRPPRSRAAATGHIVLFETPMPEIMPTHTPALTIRGPRDAIKRFIPLREFQDLFGGGILWSESRSGRSRSCQARRWGCGAGGPASASGVCSVSVGRSLRYAANRVPLSASCYEPSSAQKPAPRRFCLVVGPLPNKALQTTCGPALF